MKMVYVYAILCLLVVIPVILGIHYRSKAKRDLAIIFSRTTQALYGYEIKQAKKQMRFSQLLFRLAIIAVISLFVSAILT